MYTTVLIAQNQLTDRLSRKILLLWSTTTNWALWYIYTSRTLGVSVVVLIYDRVVIFCETVNK